MISYKMPEDELKTVKDYRNLLAESMFLSALNQRFFKISRRNDPPYFSCSAAADVLVCPLKANIMTASCKGKGTIEALESMLTEVFCIFFVSDFCIFFFHFPSLLPFAFQIYDSYILGCKGTTSWLFRAWNIDSLCATDVRDWIYLFRARSSSIYQLERWIFTSILIFFFFSSIKMDKNKLWVILEIIFSFMQHFLHNEPVVGIEYEAQLQKTLLPRELIYHVLLSSDIKFLDKSSLMPYNWAYISYFYPLDISALEVSKCSEKLRTSCSCVIKTIEPQAFAVVDALKNVVKTVNLLEEEGRISTWDDEHVPEEIVTTKPNMGWVGKEISFYIFLYFTFTFANISLCSLNLWSQTYLT